jgi:hypothetical protein
VKVVTIFRASESVSTSFTIGSVQTCSQH